MNLFRLIICVAFAVTLSTTQVDAGIIFSNNFEDGNLAPEVGTWTFAANSATTSVVGTSAAPDATLGNNVGLIDQNTNALDLTLNLLNTATLAPGHTVTVDFDVAARRTNGNTKTIFFDALDSSNNIVVRFVLGDANAFGNGGADRQRPGYDPTSAGVATTGNSTFGGTPGSFWWGSDANTATFDVIRDAHMSLTISESTFEFSTTRANGTTFSTAAPINNYDNGTYADIASFKLTSAGANYGIYLDNLVIAAVPEPGSFAVLGLSVLGLCGVRRRRQSV